MDIKESYKKVDYNSEWAIKMQKRKENEDWGRGGKRIMSRKLDVLEGSE